MKEGCKYSYDEDYYLVEKVDNVHEQMRNLGREMKATKKYSNGEG